MKDVAFCTDLFSSPATRPFSERALSCLCWALIYADMAWLYERKGELPLYDSDIRWQKEEPTGQSACKGGNGQEQFLGVRQIREQGHADCEDLASWRCAELLLGPHGPLHQPAVQVSPAFYSRPMRNGARMYHIVVRWPDGRLEDPSKKLGMGGFA